MRRGWYSKKSPMIHSTPNVKESCKHAEEQSEGEQHRTGHRGRSSRERASDEAARPHQLEHLRELFATGVAAMVNGAIFLPGEMENTYNSPVNYGVAPFPAAGAAGSRTSTAWYPEPQSAPGGPCCGPLMPTP